MAKINIAELLKDCPAGMELDCTIWENITFEEVVTVKGFDDKKRVKIILSTHYSDGTKDEIILTEFGTYTDDETAKCVIFPKGKTSWEGFQRPFKDGDVVISTLGGIAIVFNAINSALYNTYCVLYKYGDFIIGDCCICIERFATEEEKQKLFDAIKANGYKWNAETKILEKLPKFKVGDRIRSKKDAPINISNILITEVNKCSYNGVIGDTTNAAHINFKYQDLYELVPNKFDVNTLVPFKSKVLVRAGKNNTWRPAIFGCCINNKFAEFCVVGGLCWNQCIPYEGNEHLRGTTNDCNDYFKIWKEVN